MKFQLLEKLATKAITKKEAYRAVAANSELLPEVLMGISSTKPSVRYGCGSVLMELSAKYPERLYPHMDRFVALLDSEYNVLRWNALAIIANLCKVDTDRKFDAIFEKYFGLLNDEYLVTVANVVCNSGKIALAKPELMPKVTNELLKVDKINTTPHLTEECKLVIAQQAIKSFESYFDKLDDSKKAMVISFVKRYINSSRKSLKQEAELFLKKNVQ